MKTKLGNNAGIHSIFHHFDALTAWKNGKYFPPIYVDISPSSKCQHKCNFCFQSWSHEQGKIMPRELLIKIFQDLARAGVSVCEIQGEGEPFLNPALPEAIISGHSEGLKICAVTNGCAIDERTLNEILPRLSFMRFSNLENTPELYAKTHGCSDKEFYKAVATIGRAVNIKKQRALSVVITATMLVFKYNVSKIVSTVAMLKGLGVDMVHIKAAGHMERNQGQEWESVAWDEVKSEVHDAKRLENESFKVNARSDYFDFYENKGKSYDKCRGVEFAVHISSEGKVYPCYTHWGDEKYCLGDLTKQTFPQMWKGKPMMDALERFYSETKPSDCTFFCKQHTVNGVLQELIDGNGGVF